MKRLLFGTIAFCFLFVNLIPKLAQASDYLVALNFQYPFQDGTKQIFDGYGSSRAFKDCVGKPWYGRHLAIDVSSPTGTKLYAVANGKVVLSSNQSVGGYGNCGNAGYVVIIEHELNDGSKVCSLYGHVQNGAYDKDNEIGLVPNGTPVKKGDYIAKVADYWQDTNENGVCGDAGDQNWDHLHFGIRKGVFSDSDWSRYIKGYSYYQKDSQGNVLWFEDVDEDIGNICYEQENLGGNWTNPTDFIQSHQSPPTITSGWLPDTGQTKCYDNTQEIPCPSPEEPFYGQDAQYASTPMSFTKLDSNGNPLPDSATSWEMVKDNNTGLIWQKSDDQNGTSGSPLLYTWQETVDYCESLPLADHHWRLPSRRELISIVDYGRFRPVINGAFFPDCQSFGYWSNNDHAHFPGHQWFVSFYDGYIYWYMDRLYLVRCVRGDTLPSSSYVDNGNGTVTDTSTGLMWQKSDDGIQRNWQQALDYCESLPLAGHSHWRLPNIRELDSIVDHTRYNPSIDPVFGSHPTSNFTYWSSTNSQLDFSSARRVSFYDGDEYWNPKSNFYYTRCVRSNNNTVSLPPTHTTVQETHSQIDENETHWWDYVVDCVKNPIICGKQLLVVLGFNDQPTAQTNQVATLNEEQSTATFNIKIYKPDGTLYKETQSSISPIQVQIPSAAPGQWRFEVTAIEVPYPDDPYVLAIGAKDKVAATPAILQLLLN